MTIRGIDRVLAPDEVGVGLGKAEIGEDVAAALFHGCHC